MPLYCYISIDNSSQKKRKRDEENIRRREEQFQLMMDRDCNAYYKIPLNVEGQVGAACFEPIPETDFYAFLDEYETNEPYWDDGDPRHVEYSTSSNSIEEEGDFVFSNPIQIPKPTIVFTESWGGCFVPLEDDVVYFTCRYADFSESINPLEASKSLDLLYQLLSIEAPYCGIVTFMIQAHRCFRATFVFPDVNACRNELLRVGADLEYPIADLKMDEGDWTDGINPDLPEGWFRLCEGVVTDRPLYPVALFPVGGRSIAHELTKRSMFLNSQCQCFDSNRYYSLLHDEYRKRIRELLMACSDNSVARYSRRPKQTEFSQQTEQLVLINWFSGGKFAV